MDSMAAFVVELTAAADPDEIFSRLLDLRQHDRLVPLTRVTPALPAKDIRVGLRFVARSGVGPVGFHDPMMVQQLVRKGAHEPITVLIAKQGRVIQGLIEIEIIPTGAGSRLRWRQSVRLPWLPRSLQRGAARVLQLAYRRLLVRLLAAR